MKYSAKSIPKYERKKFYKNIQKVSSRKKCVKYKHLHKKNTKNLHKKILKTLVFYFTFYYNVKIFYHKES